MFAGGKNARRWIHGAADDFTRWAESIGCKELRLRGRKGWRRYLPLDNDYLMIRRFIHGSV